MSKNKLSITFDACKEAFKSKTSRRRMKEELKKSYELLEDKNDFLIIPKDKTGYFTKYLNDNYNFTINKDDELTYTVKISVTEENNKSKEKEEEEKEKKRNKLKDKLNSLKNQRSNIMGKRIKDMRKNMGDDLVKKFMEAQNSVGNNRIPDPQEILKNKDKYLGQFKEYQSMIDNMKEKNPQMAAMLEGNAYHRYASAIIDKLHK